MNIFYRYFKNYELQIYLFLAIVVAFLFRFYDLSSMNFYYDEAAYAFAARDFAEKNISPWISHAVQPPLFAWMNSIPISILGVSEFSVRLNSALFGILTILLVYNIANLWFGKKTALLASFLLAINPLHVIYSRIAFNDVIQTFLAIASILTMEFVILNKIKEKYKKLLVVISGILFGMSFLIKYNSLVILALYWIFNIRRIKYLIRFSLSAFLFVIGTIFATGGASHLVYLANSLLFWASFQYTQVLAPFYYYFFVLFDSLSPLIYVLFPLSILLLLFYKKKTRNDYLLLFLTITYIAIITMQTRRNSRYLILVMPFIILLLSRFTMVVFQYFKSIRKIYVGVLLVALIFLSSVSWTVYEIGKDLDFHVWSEAGKYIKEKYPANTVVHGSFHKNRIVKYYTQESADNSEFIGTLKKGDLVVFVWLNEGSTILDNSPYEDRSTFFKYNRTEFDNDFINYVQKHGTLIKTFDYKGKTALWLYEIKSVGAHKEDKQKEEYLQKTSLFGIWNFMCKKWSYESFVKKIMYRLLSKEQIEGVNVKCVTLT